MLLIKTAMKNTKKVNYSIDQINRMVFHMMQLAPKKDELKLTAIEGQKVVLSYRENTRIEIAF